MSSSPECWNCGKYIHSGSVTCEPCTDKGHAEERDLRADLAEAKAEVHNVRVAGKAAQDSLAKMLVNVEKREQILRKFVEMVPGTIDSVLHAASLTKSVDRWLPILQHEARVALGKQHKESSEKDFKESLKFLNDKYGGALKRLAEGPDAPKE